MCSSEAKVTLGVEVAPLPTFSRINGRPVLQPTCNRVQTPLERRGSLKKPSIKTTPPPPPPPLLPSPPKLSSASLTSKPPRASLTTPPISPKSKSPRPPAIKRGNETTGLNLSSEKVVIPRNPARSLERKKSKSFKEGSLNMMTSDQPTDASLSYQSSLIVESPGSIAAVRREQMALQHAQRKMKIAHYGRSKSAKFEYKVTPLDSSDTSSTAKNHEEEKRRCSFITANSDPIYVTYHDEEWGTPVHDDKLLFELLVLSGAQVGSDWTSILKKRQDFRDAFSGFDAETVSRLSDKQMMSISSDYGIDISRVRGVVDNANRVTEIKRQFGSFDKYVWGFVNHKAISTQYKFGHRMPVKTSKSEGISKDMVRRGFRFVGPTVVHSFMQAAGLTNDHLLTCHRHLPCTLLGAHRPATVVPDI